MKSYYLKFRKDTENISPRVSNTSNGKTMILSKLRYAEVKNQEAKGLLNNLGLRTSLSKVRILGDILFWRIKWMK